LSEYVIRKIKDEDILGIAQLHCEIWPDDFKENEKYILFWKWLFKENPCSIQEVLVGADTKEKIIAHCSLAPFRFLINGRLFTAGFICQLMVNENFRKELLFPELEVRLLKEYKDSSIDFVYGLINKPRIVKAHLAFGFKKIGIFRVYARPYKPTGLVRHFIRNRVLNLFLKPILFLLQLFLHFSWCTNKSNLEIKEVNHFDLNFDSFLIGVQKFFPISSLRSSEILNWRFVRSPDRKYQILVVKEESSVCGYAVLNRMRMKGFDVLNIVDILFSPNRIDVGKRLLNAVHREALKLKVEMSACLLNPHDPLLPVLKRCIYLKTPESFLLVLHEPKERLTDFDFEKWHLTWFDHDCV